MSTNYYMQLKEPERSSRPLSEVADWRWEDILADPDAPVEIADAHRVHIAKVSWGRLPSFQASPVAGSRGGEWFRDADDRYRIDSVQDIRDYMATGLYEIVDEDGEVYDMAAFEQVVLRWTEHMRERGFEGEPKGNLGGSLAGYADAEGYQFFRQSFS